MACYKMPEINHIIIAGNLTKDPVFHITNNKVAVINFCIASNYRFKDSKNVIREEVTHVGVVAWNKLAEVCKSKLKKGSAVLIEGELQSRFWKSPEGLNRCSIEIRANKIQFLNKNTGNDLNAEHDEFETGNAEEELNRDYTTDCFDKFVPCAESILNNKNLENNN
ncbi:MAG TPA: single-stranded DNA-binding protein [Ignavibacteriaceae bacterium]|jgi:single-strand DNA-binding protein|nr:single-stranded DNA-binding protein [Ignavibacteriaceae bacterium]